MFSRRRLEDKFMKLFNTGIGVSNILIVCLIFLFIFTNSINFFKLYSAQKFFFGTEWISLSHKYGLLPLVAGTFWVTVVALGISVPTSLLTAIYISEYASARTKQIYKILIETMSAIPSVVLGFIGLYVLKTGLNALTGGIMLAFMAIPTIVTLTDDALGALDKSYKEASLALGANKVQTIFKILVPAAFPGIFAGIMLGFGRIIGETMTVLMVTGNAPVITDSPLAPVRTLTATIAAEMGEVVQGSEHYFALFAIGLVLFFFSFLTNSIADLFIRKSRKIMG